MAGNGEGGLLSMHAAAIDKRIKKTWVIDHFGPRDRVWDEPAIEMFLDYLIILGMQKLHV